ncbi:MAG: aminotransferase class V-fold PLP-dependent enzyme [Chitinophagaceae bacterium]|nr:aminotransferase class V-fold PLP-dependent enzyme [Chitinophagaceae bacterium]
MNNNFLKSQFLLRDDITFLNFGSFGACAKPVFQQYQAFQLELEQEPVQFITVNGLQYLQESRAALAKYVNCNSKDLVYVTNPSYAVNIIAKSIDLKEGDEVLTTNLEYGACDKTWNYYCKKVGAKYIRQPITFPLTTKEQFVDDFFKGLTPKTKLVFISHITSTTGLRLPAEEIVAKAKSLGLMTFIDGAHAPGQIDVNLSTLQADIFTGACHKWMMTPKGSSFLYVKKELQHLFDPLIVSWGYEENLQSETQFLDYHQLQGTRDYSAFLTIPKAIEFMEENNWKEVSKNCRSLVQANSAKFCKLLNTKSIAPISDEFLVQLYSVPMKTAEPQKLQRLLFEKYKIEIPVMQLDDKIFLRYSIQAFNSQEDLDKLYEAIVDIKAKTNLIEV